MNKKSYDQWNKFHFALKDFLKMYTVLQWEPENCGIKRQKIAVFHVHLAV